MVLNSFEKNSFEKNICSECNICGDKSKNKSVSFCEMLFAIDKKYFICNVIMGGLIAKKSKIINNTYFSTVSGFINILCNKEKCPMYTDKCKNPEVKYYCYVYWLGVDYNYAIEDTFINECKKLNHEDKINMAWSILSKPKKKRIKSIITKLLNRYIAKKVVEQKKDYDIICTTDQQPTINITKTSEVSIANEANTSYIINDNPVWIENLKNIIGDFTI